MHSTRSPAREKVLFKVIVGDVVHYVMYWIKINQRSGIENAEQTCWLSHEHVLISLETQA